MIKPTKHAALRAQQRSIPDIMLPILLMFGEEDYQKGGTQVLRISKRKRKVIRKGLERTLKHLDSLSDTYLVLSEDGKVITVGHQY